jgi:hypothetical protein
MIGRWPVCSQVVSRLCERDLAGADAAHGLDFNAIFPVRFIGWLKLRIPDGHCYRKFVTESSTLSGKPAEAALTAEIVRLATRTPAAVRMAQFNVGYCEATLCVRDDILIFSSLKDAVKSKVPSFHNVQAGRPQRTLRVQSCLPALSQSRAAPRSNRDEAPNTNP